MKLKIKFQVILVCLTSKLRQIVFRTCYKNYVQLICPILHTYLIFTLKHKITWNWNRIKIPWLRKETIVEFADAASTPKSDRESPVANWLLRKKDVLCHFRLLSGFGDGGAALLRFLSISCRFDPIPLIISPNCDLISKLLRFPNCKCFLMAFRPWKIK